MLAQDSMTWPGAFGVTLLTGLLMVVTGFVVIRLAQRAADGRLKKNRLAGIRTRATLSSDEAWLAAHQAGQRSTVLAGQVSIAVGVVPVIVGAVLALFDLTTPDGYMIVWTVLFLIGVAGVLAAAILGAVQGNRAAKQVHNPDPLAS